MESYPAFLSSLLLSGLRWPRVAAGLGVVWVMGRVLYARGYTNEGKGNVDGRGRWDGGGFAVAAVSQVVLGVGVGVLGWEVVSS